MPVAPECDTKIEATEVVQHIVGSHAKNNPVETRTVIFLDWDDTLLCSSVLSGLRISLDTDLGATDLHQQLDELSNYVINVLNIAMSYGEVHIVTNGETGWVQLSAQKFLPRVVPYLEQVRVLSARSTFETLYPGSPMKWKFYAFQESLANHYTDPHCIKNILSFGDSHAEREAIRAVTRGLPNTRTKSIKFAERPSIEQLQRQLELVGNCFQYINDNEEDLDLCMSLSVTPNQPAEQPQQLPQQQQQPAEVVA